MKKSNSKNKILIANMILIFLLVFIIDLPSMTSINHYLIKYSGYGGSGINLWRLKAAIFFGADPNYTDEAGRNSLQISIVTGNRKVVSYLLPLSSCKTIGSALKYTDNKNALYIKEEYDRRCQAKGISTQKNEGKKILKVSPKQNLSRK